MKIPSCLPPPISIKHANYFSWLGLWLALLLSPSLALGDACGSWTLDPPNLGKNLYDVVKSDFMVAVGEGGTILTRADGGTGWTQWTPQPSPTPATLYSVIANIVDANYIAVGEGGTILQGTPNYPDNIAWSIVPRVNIPTTQNLYSVYAGLVAVGAGGTILKSTDEGNTWALKPSGTSQDLYSVYSDGYRHIAVGAGGTILISTDGGNTWTLQTSVPTTQHLYGIASFQDMMTFQNTLVVVGAGGTILISTDGGDTWTLQTYGVQTLYDIAVVQDMMMGNSLVIVGAGGTILKGTNNFGMWSWFPEFSSTSNTLRSIINGTDALVAVGHSGTTVTKGSFDMEWTPRYFSGTTNTLRDIAWNGSAYTAVGDSSTILRNYCGTAGACSYWAPQRPALSPEDFQTIEGDFHGVVGYGDFAIVVGKDLSGNGLFLVGDGAGWQQPLKDSPLTANRPLYDVTNGSNGGVVAVGDSINSIYWGGTYAFESEVGIAPLKGVSWSGENYVAVGNHSAIATGVFVPANGMNPPTIHWTPRSSPSVQDLNGIAWSGTQFVAVGNAGIILTSSDGINNWTSQTSPTTQNLFGVIWTGTQFVAVGNAGAILASPNGIDWTLQTSNTTQNLYGIAWSGKQLVAVGAGGTILTRNCSWGGALHLPANRWTQISLPAQPPSGATVEDVFGAAFPGHPYDSHWVMYQRSNGQYQKLPYTTADVLQMGVGYWIKSLFAADLNLPVTATATQLVTNNNRCPSAIGCYEITLLAPSGSNLRYSLVGMPLPYPVAWWDARIEVDGTTAYTLSAASNAGYVDKNYWIYNGNSYDVYDDVTPGQIGISQPFQGIWVAVKPGSAGHVVKLLIPVLPKLGQAPAPAAPAVARAEPAGFWQRLLDVLIAPAAADPMADIPDVQPAAARDRDRDRAKGKSERDAHNNAHSRTIQDGLEWYVRLIVEDPATGMRDRGNVFGQLADSVAGYDQHDLKELSPFGEPYLTLAFPHSDWGGNAGDYTTDYRSTDKARRGAPAANWGFEIRTDQNGRNLQLRWEGPDAVLKRSVLFDEDTGVSYPLRNPHYAQGIPVAMPNLVHRFTWRYAGKTQGKPGKDD